MAQEMEIRAVVFDWGGVLIDNPIPGMTAFLAPLFGVDGHVLEAANEPYMAELQRGTLSEGELWQRVCRDLQVSCPNQHLWQEAFRAAYVTKPDMWTLIHRLRGVGYKIALLSNTEHPAMEFFLEQQYDEFDVLAFSCAEGTRKPEPRIYELALERLGVTPAEAVHIDDRAECVQGARDTGMHAIQFMDPTQVTGELKDLGVSGIISA